MPDWLLGGLALTAGLITFAVAEHYMLRWRATACTCGRSAPWLFPRTHFRQWVFIVLALLMTGYTVWCVVTPNPTAAIVGAVITVVRWWIVKVHGSGKRKWPQKVAGLVRINEHGRLVVRPAP